MANELFLAVPSTPKNNVNSGMNLLDFNTESQQISGNGMAEVIRAVHGLDYGMEEDQLSIESLRAIGEAVSAPLSVTTDVQEMAGNTSVTQLQSQIATSNQTTAAAGNSRKKGGRNTKTSRKAAISAAPEPQQQAETSFASPQQQAETSHASLEVLTTSQDLLSNQPTYAVSQEIPNFPWQPLTVINDAFQMTTPPPAVQVPVSPAPSCVSLDPKRKVESMFAPPQPTEVPLNNRRNAVKPPNYVDQCKNKLKVYADEAMRSFADVLYMPMVNETSFGDGLEAARHLPRFRQKVWACMESLDVHQQCVMDFELAAHRCVLPLNERVAGGLTDNQNYCTVTPTRINNALKRKRLEQLESARNTSIKNEVVDFLRPPKSYCLKQWPSKSSAEQSHILQPIFEAFQLMRKDPQLKLHKYTQVNTLFDFRALARNLMEREPKYYEEFTCYLCTVGNTRVGWYKDYQNKKIDEITYVDYCKRQNATKPPNEMLCLI